MSYNDLFDSVNCKCLIIIEDDFRPNAYIKEKAIYDLTRMDLSDRAMYLAEISAISPDLVEQLSSYLSLCDKHFKNIENWECVPLNDIRPAFALMSNSDTTIEESLVVKYEAINDAQFQEVCDLGFKYGIGVNPPNVFASIYKEYLFYESRAKPVRVYFDFKAATKASFQKDLALATNEESIVCIIDNALDGNNRAQEIVETIRDASNDERKNIIGGVFSTKEIFEQINDKLYFEFTLKGTPQKLKACIAKSAYNYFISRLQKETLGTLETAFKSAVSNKGIAYYLSRMAMKEGSSEYQIITDWIKLMSSPRNADSNVIKHLITLSRVINSLDDCEDNPDNELEKFNTLEAFDYTINEYFLPVMPGDIFTNDKNDWYVLVGQDCDMARRGDGKPPKSTVAELLTVKLCPQSEVYKVANDLEKMSISNFRQSLDTPSEILQVSYRSRQYISNEIINLCSFNSDGACRIASTNEPSVEMLKLLPKHMIDYYGQLQKYYQSVKSLKEKSKGDFDTVISQAFSPRVISPDEFTYVDGQICFNLRRVCRLTHTYTFYLYRLYLEYRGRQPFESINLVQNKQLSLSVTANGKDTGQLLHFMCALPAAGAKIHQTDWVVEACEMTRILEAIGIVGTCESEIHLSEVETTKTINGKNIKFKKFSAGKIDISEA